MAMADRSVVLLVLDGWGYSDVYEGNAIAQANTPNFNTLWESYPHALLQASGESVGLPWGEMGNSEVGHLNIGAGRVVAQDLPRINAAIGDETFFQNKGLVSACEHVKTTGGALHLIGLASSGGVHSHVRHLIALLKLAKQLSVGTVLIHIFTDGRDAPVDEGIRQVRQLESQMAQLGIGKIASVCGRYFAMDRDRHWDRVERAYQAIVLGEGPTAPSAEAAIEHAYQAGQTDEFVPPTVIVDQHNQPLGKFHDSDAAVFFNFRPDRARQLTEAIVVNNFSEFPRQTPAGVYFVTMTQYKKDLPVHVAFHPNNVENSLAAVLSEHGIRQFHVAETEKYPHATFFFNGGYEDPYPLEERLLIPSPKVATYDQQPEMSVAMIGEEIAKHLAGGEFRFIMANFANADMVGHSGNFNATVAAVTAIDRTIGELVKATNRNEAFLIITADHGNAEQMVNFRTGGIDTEHTTNPVPFILVIPPGELETFQYDATKLTYDAKPKPTGLLGDVAPTVLKLFGVEPPLEMSGYGLL